MNPMAQPDLHPDADILNRFVEHALPEVERVRVVAHMADCARCREVVFLAWAAAEPEVAPSRVVQSEPRHGWLSSAFGRWRVALIPAVALATVGGTVLWVQLHPLMMNRQMAKAAAPSSAQVASPAPAQGTAQQVAPLAKQHDELAPAPSRSHSMAKTAQAERTPAPDGKKALVPGLLGMSNAASVASPPAALGSAAGIIHLDGRSAAMAQSARRPQPLAAPPMPTISAPHPGAALPPEQAKENARQMDAQPPGTVITVNGASEAAAPLPSTMVEMSDAALPVNPEFSPVAAKSGSEPALAPQQLHGLALMRLAGRPKLPSGLNTVSSAAALNRLVALDTAGSLFVSEDGGMHWVPVHAAWSGKAVEVNASTMTVSQNFFRTAPAPKAQSPELTAVSAPPPGAANASPDNTPPAPAPPAGGSSVSMAASVKAKAKATLPVLPQLFRLVTDRHEVWVSGDGKVWRRQ